MYFYYLRVTQFLSFFLFLFISYIFWIWLKIKVYIKLKVLPIGPLKYAYGIKLGLKPNEYHL